MRIAIHSATVNGGTVERVVAEVRRAAEYGLSAYWAPMLNGQDTLTALTVAGLEVADIGLATAVVPMPLRLPFALAQQVNTVQEVTGGRLTLGLGTSHESIARDLFRAEWPPPLPAARAYLNQLSDLLSGPDRGRLASVGSHTTPVLLGAVNPRMVALAVELADGVVTWAAGPATLATVSDAARDRRAPFRIVASLPVCVATDTAAVRSSIKARFGGSDNLPTYRKLFDRENVNGIADLSIVGDAGEVRRQLDAFAASGVTELAANLAGDRSDAERTLAVLAAYGTDVG